MQKKKINIYNLVLIGIFVIFLSFTIYLALNIKMGVSSDSWYHLRVSQKYAETLGIPENGPDTYQWRDIEHIPYLYFWINGRLLNLNSITFHFNEAIILRFFNILYSLGTLLGTYLLSKQFFKKRSLQLLPVFLLSNTLMFLFLSSSINYDNLGNLFSVFSLLFFVKAIKKKGDWKNIFLMLIMLCLGILTKFTIVPLAFILVLLITIYVIKNWKSYKKSFKGKILYLLIPLGVLIGMNLGIYGVNLIKYHSLTPECLDVLTYDQCLENGVFVRDTLWIPKQEIHLFKMIFSGERLDPVRYTWIWMREMTRRIVGIMGDSSLFASYDIIPFYIGFLGISIISVVRYRKDFNKESKFLCISTLFYLLVLLFVQNYATYLRQGYPTLALQGRYMFPVISSFYILFVYSLSKIKKRWLRGVVFIGLITLFVIGCLPFFFLNVDSNWFGSINY
ncbi:MAG: glycosyltransferase family 39 protein [Candidatus Dojkabacteria bacterium]|nr:glycosyltransferase family 39 protein [Candidatus Dojkabacteria bacterium]